MVFLVFIISILSSIYLGNCAFAQGMAVKRWSFAGLLMGPLAYPLFNSHKYLLTRKLAVSNEQQQYF
ncbi:hypothetical protein BCU91_16040 [Shewanella sp. 10N.286.52.B9]|nr:hypothetical protein BCU91_16040 [Shewanella sp. 10N.286.52.B9]